jgi:hypothetical protein
MSDVITKPIVHYRGDCTFSMTPMDKEVATIYDVVNHPKLGHQRVVYTSEVINKFDEGVFETRNTLYVKVEK